MSNMGIASRRNAAPIDEYDSDHLSAFVMDLGAAQDADGPLAQWIKLRPTEPGIAGSSPAGVIFSPPHSLSIRAT